MAYRIPRVNQLIRQEISGLLKLEIKDPRLAEFVAVTGVETSADLRHAKVFVSTMCTEEEKEKTLEALSSAAGFFHHEMKKHLRLRRIPSLSFHWDDSIARGDYLNRLIDSVNLPDESR